MLPDHWCINPATALLTSSPLRRPRPRSRCFTPPALRPDRAATQATPTAREPGGTEATPGGRLPRLAAAGPLCPQRRAADRHPGAGYEATRAQDNGDDDELSPVAYRIAYVFDVSQPTVRPCRRSATGLGGYSPAGGSVRLVRLAAELSYSVAFTELPAGRNGD